MKKTLQDQYLLIKEGKGHKDVFIKEAKQQFPGLIRNAATFTEVANVLKTKNLINENVIGLEPINQLEPSKKESYEVAFENFLAEAKKKKEEDEKAELKKPSKQVEEDAEKNFDYEDKKNPDNLIFDQIMKGYYTEMKDPKNEDKTMEQLKAIVVKNLEKNPIYYTEKGQFGVKDLGYTLDAPGLGEPKEPKGKYKSSGYGDLKEEKKMSIPYTGQARPTTPEEDEEFRQEKEREENEEDALRGGRLELDEEPINEKQYTPQQKTDIIDAYGKDKTDENMREIVKLIGSGEIDKDYVVFRLEDKWGYKGGKEQFTTTMKQISLGEAQIREAIRSMINEELEEILQINPVSGGGGRRFIPTNYLLPDSLISKLNLSNPGPNAPAYDESTQIPHIKVFSRDGEAAIYISDLFYVALKGVTRGRSTRAQNVAKATLQKIQDNFTEKDWPAIRALLKKFAYDKLSNIPVKGEIRPYHEIMFPEGYSLKIVDNGVMIDLPPYKPDTLPESKIRKVIKESIEKELAQINKEAEYEVLDSKLEKITDLIDKRKLRLAKLDEDEDIKALTDKKKVKQFEKEIKTLEKAKFKIEKVLAKKTKSAPKKKEMIDEDEPLEEFTKSAEDAKELETTIGNLKPEIEDLKTSIDSLEEDDSLEENNTYGYRYV